MIPQLRNVRSISPVRPALGVVTQKLTYNQQDQVETRNEDTKATLVRIIGP